MKDKINFLDYLRKNVASFGNTCHDPHSGQFCELHNVVHPDAQAAASRGYGIERWQREQKMKKTGLSYSPYGKDKPLDTNTKHLSDQLKRIGVTLSGNQIVDLIQNTTPTYIQHEATSNQKQSPVYHYDTGLGFELGFAIDHQGVIRTVIPTGYAIEAEALKKYEEAGSPPITRGNNLRADIKRDLAKNLVKTKGQPKTPTPTPTPTKAVTPPATPPAKKIKAPDWLTMQQAAAYQRHKTQEAKDAYVAQLEEQRKGGA